MPRTAASGIADRIRIEDEVWQEAFASRVRARPRRTDGSITRRSDDSVTRRVIDSTPRPSGDPAARSFSSWLDEPAEPPRPVGAAEPSGGASAAESPRPAHPRSSEELPPRRTVRIQGRGAERNLPVGQGIASTRPRSSPLVEYRSGFEPDRLAMWAVLLGIALVAVAILSSSF